MRLRAGVLRDEVGDLLGLLADHDVLRHRAGGEAAVADRVEDAGPSPPCAGRSSGRPCTRASAASSPSPRCRPPSACGSPRSARRRAARPRSRDPTWRARSPRDPQADQPHDERGQAEHDERAAHQGGAAYGTIAPFLHDATPPPPPLSPRSPAAARSEPAAVKAKHHRIAIDARGLPATRPRRSSATPGRLTARQSPTTAASPTRCGCRSGDQNVVAKTTSLLPGDRTSKTLKVQQAADYRFFCALSNHEELGMYGTLIVSDEAVDPTRFRTVMGHFATGVAVVTVDTPARPGGHDRQRGPSLSLDPVLAARLLRQRRAHAARGRARAKRFGVNVLAAGQEHLARLFASKDAEHEVRRRPPHGPRRHPGARRHARLGRLRARAADPRRRPHDRDRRRARRRAAASRARAADLVPRPLYGARMTTFHIVARRRPRSSSTSPPACSAPTRGPRRVTATRSGPCCAPARRSWWSRRSTAPSCS